MLIFNVYLFFLSIVFWLLSDCDFNILEETVPEEVNLSVRDVVDLLEEQNAIITGEKKNRLIIFSMIYFITFVFNIFIFSGGKTKEGFPIITLPDLANFSNLLDGDYQKLMTYLTSVPSLVNLL